MQTMVGIGSNPSDLHDTEFEPVHLLTRRRSSVPPPLVAPRGVADESVTSDEISDIRLVPRVARRSRAIRLAGMLAIAAVLAGGSFVVQQPRVRREALSFVTMGHEDAAARFGRRIESIVERVRGR